MKKFIFPFLIILAACHDNDRDVTPVPTPPYQFNGEIAYQALSWATPHFTHGTNLTIHRPEAPEEKLSVAHGFYLRNEKKTCFVTPKF